MMGESERAAGRMPGIARQPGRISRHRRKVSDFCGEIEESCLLVCHFYLPKERAYRYKSRIGQVSLADAYRLLPVTETWPETDFVAPDYLFWLTVSWSWLVTLRARKRCARESSLGVEVFWPLWIKNLLLRECWTFLAFA